LLLVLVGQAEITVLTLRDSVLLLLVVGAVVTLRLAQVQMVDVVVVALVSTL
jgi:hypothetical protein